MSWKVLVADDHPLLRDALSRTLRSAEPEAQVIEAFDYATAAEALRLHRPDLGLLDLHMPGMDGVEGVRRLRQGFPAVPLVVVSGEDDPAVIRAVLAAGAVGFLPKSESPTVMQQALRLVRSGGTYMPPQALANLDPGARPSAGSTRPDASGLTPRQRDVLKSLLRGQPNKLIARELGLTEGTVKIHIAAILRALQARNRTEAVVVARRLGLDG